MIITQMTNAVRMLIATLLACVLSANANAESQLYFVHTDHLGTPQVVTDKNQNVVWKGEYTPFGEVKEVVNTLEQNVRFPGQYFDQETGLHYNYFRDYDPSLGRYVQSDPIGLKGGINTYAYVEGNPLKYSDPRGLAAILGYCFVPGVGWAVCTAAAEAAVSACATVGTAVAGSLLGALLTEAASPEISPSDVAGKTPEEIDQLAKDKGLNPQGPDPMSGKGSYTDPVTGKQRVLCHPNCGSPHAHVNNPKGERLDSNGNVVAPESPAAHLPINY